MNRLLNKTMLYYAFFAVILLLLSGPLFYSLSEKLYLDDVDEAILLRKKEFYSGHLHALKAAEIPTWNKFNRDIHILPDTVNNVKEKIFQQVFYDSLANEWEPYRILYSNVSIEGKPYTLMIRLNLVESQDLIETTALLYLIILGVLLAGFLVISKLVSNRLWQPFHDTLSQIAHFNIDANEMPAFPKTSTKEFLQLNAALERLIRHNLVAYQTQKEFTQNAAHELQTPLAIFQSKLDLLLQNSSLTQQQADILQSLYEAASRLSRITKNLLLLAKIENSQFSETTQFELKELLHHLLPCFGEQAESKQLIITQDIANSLPVRANRGLVEIMISNLLLNAIRHNVHQGKVSIYISPRQFTVVNTAPGDALDAAALFKRFGKIAVHPHGSGLGLAIVKQICERYGWKVNYDFKDHLHVFSIDF